MVKIQRVVEHYLASAFKQWKAAPSVLFYWWDCYNLLDGWICNLLNWGNCVHFKSLEWCAAASCKLRKEFDSLRSTDLNRLQSAVYFISGGGAVVVKRSWDSINKNPTRYNSMSSDLFYCRFTLQVIISVQLLPSNVAYQATLEGSSCTDIMTCRVNLQ